MGKTETEMKCETCAFFAVRDEQVYIYKGEGECHRYAPRRVSGVGTGCEEQKWPTVVKSDFCGEHLSMSGEGERLVKLLMNLAYEWRYYDGAGQRNNPYRHKAKSRCMTLCDELVRLLSQCAIDDLYILRDGVYNEAPEM